MVVAPSLSDQAFFCNSYFHRPQLLGSSVRKLFFAKLVFSNFQFQILIFRSIFDLEGCFRSHSTGNCVQIQDLVLTSYPQSGTFSYAGTHIITCWVLARYGNWFSCFACSVRRRVATYGDRRRRRNSKTPVTGDAWPGHSAEDADGDASGRSPHPIAANTNCHTNDRRLHTERLGRRPTIVTTARAARPDIHSVHRRLRQLRSTDWLALADRRVSRTGSFGWVICSLIILF